MITESEIVEKNFNRIGPIYNGLKSFFMANNPEKVIRKSVDLLPFHSAVLVVGGGADNTVLEILKAKKCDGVVHLDISRVLSKRGKNRLNALSKSDRSKTEFLIDPFLNFKTKQKFDAVIFPFYLDLFEDEEIQFNLIKLQKHISKESSVYVVDFHKENNSNVWNRLKEFGLYFLFSPITKVKRRAFPDLEKLFTANGFFMLRKQLFYRGFYVFFEFKLTPK